VQVLGLPGWRRFLAKLNWRSPLNELLLGKDEPVPTKALHSYARGWIPSDLALTQRIS
jgi:hypothetical protein